MLIGDAADGIGTSDRKSVIGHLHVWLGGLALLYVMFVSVTGCAIVFEPELYRLFSPDPHFRVDPERRLAARELRSILNARHGDGAIAGIWDRRLSAGMVSEVWLGSTHGITRRLVHPQTGEDLGSAEPLSLFILGTLRHAHQAVLGGTLGWFTNLAGALSLVVLSISGIALRCRRRQRRERALGLRERKPAPNSRAFAYHSIAGAGTFVCGAVWGVTGACFALPPSVPRLLGGAEEPVFKWLYLVHTGMAGGDLMRAAWLVAALGVVLLAGTGAVMLWMKAMPPSRADRAEFVVPAKAGTQ